MLSETEQWRTSNCKLRELKENISPWPRALNIKRQEQTTLNRIRTGHTLITHAYLMDSDAPQIPPICHFCNNSTLNKTCLHPVYSAVRYQTKAF